MQSYATYCDTWSKETGGDLDKCRANAKASDTVNEAGAATLATAYGASVVGSQTYVSNGLETEFAAFAVRARSPLLWSRRDTSAFNESVGVALVETVVRDGAAECLVRPANGIISAGTSYTDADLVASECQATGDGLTVRVEGSANVQQALDFTNLLYSDLGGAPSPDGASAMASTDTDPISMPESVAGLESYAGFCGTWFAESEAKVEACRVNADAAHAVAQAAAATLTTAYGGSATASQTYAGNWDTDPTLPEAFAVRASSPHLWSRMDSDAFNVRTNVALLETVVRDGMAECLAQGKDGVIAPYGQSYTHADLTPSECQATGAGLTVRVFDFGEMSVDDALAFTNALYGELGGQ